MFTSGYWTVFRWRGVPIRLHWTLPVGAAVVGGFQLVPGVWIGFFVLVLLHEMGHAVLAWRRQARVVAIHVHGLGGECVYRGEVSPLSRSIIAWGGVLAQALVLAGALVARGVLGPPRHWFVAELAHVAIQSNIFLIALNLLPFEPLDGAEAWRLFGRWRRSRAERAVKPAVRKPRVEGPIVIDQGHVAETVREALERARREAREERERQR